MDKKVNKNLKKEADEFKKFISRGSVVDMAIGVIIGGAFGKIVSSLVNDIIMPLVGVILGGLDFSSLSIKVGDASIKYGSFIQSVVDFLIIALCIFTMLQILNSIKEKADKKLGHKKEEEKAKKDEQIILLEEIRDLLKNSK
ncbi:MAG: large-conductance mechanosensitive channel protein MscL [bacterium]|nr:large-conductance mechanosensitive channel protein MscL [bacterium]